MTYSHNENDNYDRYIVHTKTTNAGEIEERECPLCHERISDFEGKRSTVFLAHLSLDKNEHQPLNLLCDCGHTRVSHLDSNDKGIGFGSCSFSRTCGCVEFRARK